MTISIDGFVKFWRKQQLGIAFVKSYKAHSGKVVSAALSLDQNRMVTAGCDKFLKIFDVANFDLITSIKTGFEPGPAIEFLKSPFSYKFIVSECDQSNLYVFKEDQMIKKMENVLEFPIQCLKYSSAFDLLIVLDSKSNLEFVDLDTYDFPTNLAFELMSDTDFLSIADE